MPSRFSRDPLKIAGAASIGAAGVAALIAGINRLVSATAPAPQPPLKVEPQLYAWTEGDVSYSVAGQGQAVVLLHGVYAGASSFEFRRVFQALSQHFRVFAPDLPGFGRSARPARVYEPQLYVDLIHDFTRQVAGGADHPVHIIASSLSCAFVIEAAASRPDLFNRLVLIEPTGMNELSLPPSAGQRFLGNLMRAPLIGTSFYNMLVSRSGLRYYLSQQVYRDKSEVTDDLIDAYYATSHQPNARYAAASFISGSLNADIGELYELLDQPILLCWGQGSRFSPIDNAESFLERNALSELAIFDRSAALPHDEEAEDFITQVSAWLRSGISSRR